MCGWSSASTDGRFYDIANDVLEKDPLDDSALTHEVRRIRDMLSAAIEKHTRPGFYERRK